jgi:hypothetical protein
MSSRSHSSDALTPQLLAAVRAQLAAGERLTWAACPELLAFEPKARSKGKWDAAVILGGGYATLAACVMALRSGKWLWLCVPIALLLIGALAYFVASRIKARARRVVTGTVYALTTQRGLIMHTYPALTVRALPIHAIAAVRVINRHARADLADLSLDEGDPDSTHAFVFRGVAEPESARSQLLRVIRDPEATERELAASEAYAMAMRQLMVRPARV